MRRSKPEMTVVNMQNPKGELIASLELPAMSVEAVLEFYEAWQRRPTEPTTKRAYIRAFKRAYWQAFRAFERGEAEVERTPETLMEDEVFRSRLRGEYALQCVNGAGVQEEDSTIPRDFLKWMRAYDEAVKWHGRGKAA